MYESRSAIQVVADRVKELQKMDVNERNHISWWFWKKAIHFNKQLLTKLVGGDPERLKKYIGG